MEASTTAVPLFVAARTVAPMLHIEGSMPTVVDITVTAAFMRAEAFMPADTS